MRQIRLEIEGHLPDNFYNYIREIKRGELLDNGNTIGIYAPYEDVTKEELKQVLRKEPSNISYHIFEGPQLLFIGIFDPPDLATRIFEISRDNNIMLDWPIENMQSQKIRFTLLGSESEIQKSMKDLSEIGDLDFISIGEFEGGKQLATSLSSKQRVVLEEAISMGYYEIPKECSQRDIAAELEISPGTVGEHLRKIESQVLSSLN